MSSANNHKRDRLEEEFFFRMHDAEASPAPDLWARIDHDLTVQENERNKKRVLLYRQLAAACFVLFMLAGSALVYNYKTGMQPKGGSFAGQAVPGSQQHDPAATAEAGLAPQRAELAQATATHPETAVAAGEGAVAETGESTVAEVPALAYQAQRSAAEPARAAASNELREHATYRSTERRSATLVSATVPEGITFIPETTVLAATPGQAEKSEGAAGRSLLQQPGEATTTALPKSIAEFNRRFAMASTAADNLKQQKQTEALQSSLNNGNSKKQSDNEATRDSRWSVSMAYTPSYFDQNIGIPDQMMSAVSKYSFAADGPSATMQTSQNIEAARDEYENNTDPAFSYAVDVKAGFKLGKKLKLLTGIGFSQNSARTKTSYVVRQFWFKPRTNERYELNPSTIFLPSLNNGFTTDSISVARTDAFDVNYKYRHVSVPLALQYEGNIAKSWYWYAAGGMAANFLVESSVEASAEEVKSVNYDHSDDSPFRKVQLSGNMAVGVGKRLSETVTVALGPEIRSYLSTLLAEPDKAMAPQGKPYTIGVSMGLNYNLGSIKK